MEPGTQSDRFARTDRRHAHPLGNGRTAHREKNARRVASTRAHSRVGLLHDRSLFWRASQKVRKKRHPQIIWEKGKGSLAYDLRVDPNEERPLDSVPDFLTTALEF